MNPLRSLIYCLFALILTSISCKMAGIEKVENKWENGKVKAVGWEKNGKKLGQWKNYSSTGWLESRERWKNGNWKWSIFYNEKHEKLSWKNAKGEEKKYQSCGCNR